MTLRIVRLGSARVKGEGTRIGAVRHLPRGVKKERYGPDDWLDVWYPELSPSAPLVKRALGAKSQKEWNAFVRSFRSEMKKPSAQHTLQLLATLSHHSDFSIGCYCEQEGRCHRSVLRELLAKQGAKIG